MYYSRKVFVGGLPIDVTEANLRQTFGKFGLMKVEWPEHVFTPSKDIPGHQRGFVFLLYEDQVSVQALVFSCFREAGQLYSMVSNGGGEAGGKIVQVRPWYLPDAVFMPEPSRLMDPRCTVFIGALPRPIKARDLASILSVQYGKVCYAAIYLDSSFIRAMVGHFVNVPNTDGVKRLEIKPYIVGGQLCDNCSGLMTSAPAPYFCAEVSCLQYYCEPCWYLIHQPYGVGERGKHKPFVRISDTVQRRFANPRHLNSTAFF